MKIPVDIQEKWIESLEHGDTPKNNFASKMALEWLEQFEKLIK
jgi:hypothetical protein